MSPAVIVAVEDSANNIVTTDDSNITLNLSPSTATLGGQSTVAAMKGQAIFSGVTVSTAGTYRLVAKDAGDVPVFSDQFTVAGSTGSSSRDKIIQAIQGLQDAIIAYQNAEIDCFAEADLALIEEITANSSLASVANTMAGDILSMTKDSLTTVVASLSASLDPTEVAIDAISDFAKYLLTDVLESGAKWIGATLATWRTGLASAADGVKYIEGQLTTDLASSLLNDDPASPNNLAEEFSNKLPGTLDPSFPTASVLTEIDAVTQRIKEFTPQACGTPTEGDLVWTIPGTAPTVTPLLLGTSAAQAPNLPWIANVATTTKTVNAVLSDISSGWLAVGAGVKAVVSFTGAGAPPAEALYWGGNGVLNTLTAVSSGVDLAACGFADYEQFNGLNTLRVDVLQIRDWLQNVTDGLVSIATPPQTFSSATFAVGGLTINNVTGGWVGCTAPGTASISVTNTGTSSGQAEGILDVYRLVREPSGLISGYELVDRVDSTNQPTLDAGKSTSLTFSFNVPDGQLFNTEDYYAQCTVIDTQGVAVVNTTFQATSALSGVIDDLGQSVLASVAKAGQAVGTWVKNFGSAIRADFVLAYPGSDMDLQIYDSAGNHVGYDYATGQIELGIPGAEYDPGTAGSPQQIEVPVSAGDQLYVETDALQTAESENFSVEMSTLAQHPATLCVSPNQIGVSTAAGGNAEFDLSVGEGGGQQGLTGVTVAISDLSGPSGSVIPHSNISFTAPPTTIGAGTQADVAFQLTAPTVVGAYDGTVQVTSDGGSYTVPVELDVTTKPAFSHLSSTVHSSYGTTSVSFSGTVTAGTLIPPDTETVAVTLNGVTQNAAIDAYGNFSAAFDTSQLTASATPYQVTYLYLGDADFNSASDDTTTTLAVTPAVPKVNVADVYNGGAFPAAATVAGVVSGVDTTPAPSLEGSTPTLSYYAGSLDAAQVATATPLSGAPTAPGIYTVVASFPGSTDYAQATSSPVPFDTIYDAENDGRIGIGEYGLFVNDWLATPGSPNWNDGRSDFENDHIVSIGDYGLLVGNWLKYDNDPTITPPPTFSPAATSVKHAFASTVSSDASTPEVDVELVPVPTVAPLSTSDSAPSLPTAITQASVGTTFYVEVWAKDVTPFGSGITGVDLDFSFDPKVVTGGTVANTSPFGYLTVSSPYNTVDNTLGQVDDLNGSVSLSDPNNKNYGVNDWVCVGYVPFTATAVGPVNFTALAGSLGPTFGTTAGGVHFQNVESNQVQSGSLTITPPSTVTTTTTLVTDHPSGSVYGDTVTFTATVTNTIGSDVPTGSVEFWDGTTDLGAGTALSGSGTTATSTFTTTTLDAETHPSIHAVYTATGSFVGSTSGNLDQTVNQRPITLTGNRTYDGTPTADSSTLSITNVVGSDSISLASGSAALSGKDVGTPSISSNTLKLTGAAASNYTTVGATATVTISAKTLFVSGLDAAGKVYDGTTAATLSGTAALLTAESAGSGSASDGKPYSGDTVTLGGTAVGTFASKDVANGIVVKITGNSLDGSQAGDYQLPTADEENGAVSANITPKTLTASIIGDPTKTYDGSATATLTSSNYSLSGLVGTDNFTVTQTAGAYNSKDVATANTVTASLATGNFTPVGSALLTNYTLPTSAGGPGHITKTNATIIVAGVTVHNGGSSAGYTFAYDGNSHTDTGSATGVGGVDLTSELDLTGTKQTNVGAYRDPWTFTDASGDYNNASGTVNDTITSNNPTTNAVYLTPDPLVSGQDVLYVWGTTRNDIIRINSAGSAYGVSVMMNGVGRGTFGSATQQISRIVAHGLGGSDMIGVSPMVTVPAWLYGDDGSDILMGGGGPTYLFGGGGNDILVGGRMRNILIGGAGRDILIGGMGDAILIGGTTAYDSTSLTDASHDQALLDILKEWNTHYSANRVTDYLTRVRHITGTLSGGANRPYYLRSGTVFNDHAPDIVIGNAAAMDLFFKSAGDMVVGRRVGDLPPISV